MGHGRPRLEPDQLRVERTETHGTREAPNGIVMVAAGYPLEAAQVPGGRKIGVQYQGPVQQGDAGVQIAAEVAKRMAASRERHRVVPDRKRTRLNSSH